ncbi:MAG: hypothetical protein IPM79_37690 [Polyangiaceae bacterium]|nr:hypothetical protein [Polyangiaceae bacterium]MBK8943182.1 hypothetical protein [Polyangiaceae bacterium]
MTTAHSKTNETNDNNRRARHVRVRMPPQLYRRLRHLLIDRETAVGLSDLIVELLDDALPEAE